MEWVQSINRAIEYMETHLTENIHCEDISNYVHISSFHFQIGRASCRERV